MQADRSLRSVFVGNIPYDATEEKLRDIFSAVGPVLSFRIVFDRETGKPKGYGFCEYKDQETATSAIRNLNGHDLGGRQLRVDSASNERARDEPDQNQQLQQQQQPGQQQQQQQSQQQTIGGDNNQMQHQAQTAPEPLVDPQTVINNVLCSLPPEHLFDLCKQLKESLAINPNETKQMLVQNPQLCFAVLQSLVMIKAIDAQTAMNTLHKQLMQPAVLQPAPMQPTMPAMMAMMQPQVLNPYAFAVGAQPAGLVGAPPVQAPAPLAPVPQSNPNPVPADPRLGHNDPRLVPGSVDPRLASSDPRVNSSIAASTADPRLIAADPRLARQQQQQQQSQSQQHQQPQPTQVPGWPFVGAQSM